MSMEDILQALMQSAASKPQAQQSGGGDAMAQMLSGMLGGGQMQSPQQQTGGDAMSQMLGGLLGGQSQGGSSDLVTQAIGGLLGSQQNTGGAGVGGLLGGLQQILGGTPGSGQLPMMGGGSTGMAAGGPLMALLQPVVNNVAAKLGISPQVATIVASIALHYLLQSSPNTPGSSPLNLGSVLQTLASGRSVSPTALQKSGMVNDVMQATGMNQQQAVRSLNTTLGVLGTSLPRVQATTRATVRKTGSAGTRTISRKTGRTLKTRATAKRRGR